MSAAESEGDRARPYGLLEGVGVEIELCIVHQPELDVLAAADVVLRDDAGEITGELERGAFSWSNELVAHVLELKTNGAVARLDGIASGLTREVRAANRRLAPVGGVLLPTAMHPWMEPLRETRLWPHEYHEVYQTFHRHFDCHRHGWANLQSVHVNLPFVTDQDFARLHAAVRLVLPLLPALAASSPIVEGRVTGLADTRLDLYRSNSSRYPAITGAVIPEPVFSEAQYEAEILGPIARVIEELGESAQMHPEWVNARGAIARFDRGSVEIRVIDTQESASMSLAVVAFGVEVVRALVEGRWASLAEQQCFDVAALDRLLRATTRDAERATIDDSRFSIALGRDGQPCSAAALLRALRAELAEPLRAFDSELAVLLDHGSLATRIVSATGPAPDAERLRRVYGQLCECLDADRPFLPGVIR